MLPTSAIAPLHIFLSLSLSRVMPLCSLLSILSLYWRDSEEPKLCTHHYVPLSLSLYVEIERVARAADVASSAPLCLLSPPPPRRRRYVRNHSVCYRPLLAPTSHTSLSLSLERDASLLSALYSLSLERESLTS